MGEEITPLFREVLMICDELELIGREMFASDGCKLPSNASKEWSGTKGREDREDGVGRPLYSQEATGRKRTKPALPTASKRATAARDFCVGVSGRAAGRGEYHPLRADHFGQNRSMSNDSCRWCLIDSRYTASPIKAYRMR